MSDFKRINIYENDLTTNPVQELTTDVVYIPGFAISSLATVAARVPKICRTVLQFESYFGTEAPRFSSIQNYPVAADASHGIELSSGTYAGFISNGIPAPEQTGTVTVMFNAQDCDPSYIYAKELIAAGFR